MSKKGFSTILIIVIVLVVITAGVLAWQYWPIEEVKQNPTIEEIMENPGLYEGQIITLAGYFGGWGCGLIYDGEGPVSVSKSDTGIYNDTGCLYMTREFDVLYKERELNPLDSSNIGGEITIRGMVSLIDGKPIIGSSQGKPIDYSNLNNNEAVSPKPELLQQELIDEIADWQTYRNEKYGFEIRYPLQNWQTQGGNDRYEIRNGGAFVLMGMAERNVDSSLEDWFEKKYNYYINVPDGNPIYARPYNSENITDYIFNGISSKKTQPISFDHSEIAFYFKKGTDILYVSYSESVPNDQGFVNKIDKRDQILSTFKFSN